VIAADIGRGNIELEEGRDEMGTNLFLDQGE
jgi:hypothetical protein